MDCPRVWEERMREMQKAREAVGLLQRWCSALHRHKIQPSKLQELDVSALNPASTAIRGQ